MSEYVKFNDYDVYFKDVYNGTISLAVGYLGKDGEPKVRWIKREFGRDNWKDTPFRYPLGASEDEALAMYRAIGIMMFGDRFIETGGADDAPF